MVVNVERLRSQAAKSKGYGVKVGKDVIVLIIIANIEWDASQEWGGEFRDAMRSIRCEFTSPFLTCGPLDVRNDDEDDNILADLHTISVGFRGLRTKAFDIDHHLDAEVGLG